MERKFSIGLAVGLAISGAGSLTVDFNECIGIGLLLVAAIVWFLFIFSKSPVKRHWWSIADRLGVVLIQRIGVSNRYLTAYIGLRAVSEIQVDKIGLKIGNNKVLVSDWKPMLVVADEPRYVNFERPNWLKSGEYEGYLIANTPEGFAKSKKVPIVVPPLA